MLKYKCLVLDHDDTVAQSTPEIHFPVFKNTLSKLRPDTKMTLDEFMMYCFDPGFHSLCFDILKFTEEEMNYQVNTWKEHVKSNIPAFYPGFEKIIKRQKEEGGLVCVVSHSYSENIKRDYLKNCGIIPDMIFGWERCEEERKPNPYPLKEIMFKYNLKPEDLIMVDDLKPGSDMAKACNVAFAGAGWSHTNKLIIDFMKENCDHYFSNVIELEKFLFE
ncbi:phosphoglycolate phosphatase [Clostridium cavendishii DSM 21758]|uniref:Phosphoglycolate phosphatase n=1 Tax=Clostridium cavendishii DSM 21758 TaxID=1121302 RepID=A0A1M6NHK5_9CLOT|nr:HAD hydrolase-like protein [Clostridium cavendishii]SHJ95180.1 phosphoglycolate phosphatase [Clostridium cavendishii DSM 21758]